jgi:hypothetical protein
MRLDNTHWGEWGATVAVGQVWEADFSPGRTVRVDHIGDGYVTCTVLTNSDRSQKGLDEKRPGVRDRRGETTRLQTGRFRHGAGYRLIEGDISADERLAAARRALEGYENWLHDPQGTLSPETVAGLASAARWFVEDHGPAR